MSVLKKSLLAASLGLMLTSSPVQAEPLTKVVIGSSGWTGFAPLTLAEQKGFFKNHGLDVEIKSIPVKDRLLAYAAGSLQCAATTIDTFVAWNANNVPITQIFLLDLSHGADGLVVRNDIHSVQDLKGKTISVETAGASPYFMLSYILRKNGMTMNDIKTNTLSPQAAAQAFVAGQAEAAMTYEPYMTTVRDNPSAGKILATTVEYPAIIDLLGCQPDFLKANPKVGAALVNGYQDALDFIQSNETEAFTIMGAKVKQTAEQFKLSSSFLTWKTKAESQAYFANEILPFMQETADILLETKVIRKKPENFDAMYDASYVK